MASPRAFSGLLKRPTEPFDWPRFFRTFAFQPVPLWLLLSAVSEPFARAFPALSRAACQGRLRESLSSIALVVYTIAVPCLVTTFYYLPVGRRRLEKADHRLIGDVTFGIMVVLSVADAAIMLHRIHEQWTVLQPGLKAIRAACWP